MWAPYPPVLYSEISLADRPPPLPLCVQGMKGDKQTPYSSSRKGPAIYIVAETGDSRKFQPVPGCSRQRGPRLAVRGAPGGQAARSAERQAGWPASTAHGAARAWPPGWRLALDAAAPSESSFQTRSGRKKKMCFNNIFADTGK